MKNIYILVSVLECLLTVKMHINDNLKEEGNNVVYQEY